MQKAYAAFWREGQKSGKLLLSYLWGGSFSQNQNPSSLLTATSLGEMMGAGGCLFVHLHSMSQMNIDERAVMVRSNSGTMLTLMTALSIWLNVTGWEG